MDNVWDTSYSPDQLMWTIVFATPSLTNLSIPLTDPHNPPAISYRTASAILKILTQHQPDLQELSLFPDSGLGRHQDDGENKLLTFVSGEPFHHYLVGASNLRHLSGTMAWLQHEPRLILSKLPLLESITIYSALDTLDADKMPGLSEHSFPALRQLSMFGVDPHDALKVLGATGMFRRIEYLNIDIDIGRFHRGEFADLWLIDDFFPVLSNMPRLCGLSLKIPGIDDIEPLSAITPSILNILSALPLLSVTLGNMECSITPWPDHFGMIWSLVTKLCIPEQALSLDSLHPFATLPKLQHLELKLDVQWLFAPSTPEPGPRAPLHTLVSTHHQTEERDCSDADEVVRWLLSHWPNLIRMVCPSPDITKELGDTLDREYFDLLNHGLNKLYAPEHQSD
ncbi:hypothetical protein BDV93DRAFT_608922 [Ceratobasidium sp. AG-I]|nr:hypothetical protein BDV93DRAFT_608922 [Ceratobasidium sp. AG-I]